MTAKVTRACDLDHAGRGRRDFTVTDRLVALQLAFEAAVVGFVDEHGRYPDWDMTNFRGGYTTTEVLVELIEEQP